MNQEMLDGFLVLSQKESMLTQIIVWLRAKGLWEECQKDLLTKTTATVTRLVHGGKEGA